MAIRLTREQRAADPNRGAARLPPLSAAFINEADAAYWAHRQIGNRRDVEYGGVIVRDAAGDYFATQPVPGKSMQFDTREVLSLDGKGSYLQPPGYTCVAHYHSHPAQHAMIRQKNASFDERMTKAFLGFFSATDIALNVRDRDFFPANYLSGPDGTLIRHVPTGTPAEFSFSLWLLAGKPPNNPVGVYGGFDEFIKKVSTLSQLSLIVPTALWGGSIGKVPADWVVFEPFSSSAVTEPPLFTAIAGQAQLAVEDAEADALDYVGFVLKLNGKDRFVATVTAPRREPLFAPHALFPLRADGLAQLPTDYRLEAIYFSHWYAKEQVAAREEWLASALFSPEQVVAAIAQGHRTSAIQDPVRGLDLYMRAPDRALLKFKVPPAALDSALFKRRDDGTFHDNGNREALTSGALRPRNYLRRLLDSGELWVVQAGRLWHETGRVDNRSAVLTPFYLVTLSRSFVHARDAAVYAHEQVNNRRDRYFGGYVLKDDDNRFIITEPLECGVNPFADTLLFTQGMGGPVIPPEGYEVHGRFGSHTALSMVDPDWVAQRGWTREEALTNLQVFSDDEMFAVISGGRVAYLSGAQDCLLEYTPNNSAQEQVILANLGPSAGENRLGLRLDRGQIKPVDWVQRLAGAGEFKIIQGNALWGPRGVVYGDWSPGFAYAPRLGPLDYVTYGAIFASADEAARDLHARVHRHHRSERACYAYILKHKDQPQYIATQAVGARSEGDLFKRFRLFSRDHRNEPLLPDGFELQALFKSQQWVPHWLKTANAWLTRYFVTPGMLLVGLIEALRDRTFSLPIYFSTLDGALLRYLPSPIDVKTGGVADNLLGLATTQLESGVKKPVEFIQDWASRGMLYVVHTSQLWDRAGLVKGGWTGYETLAARRLSPAFASPDDAARHAAVQVGSGQRRTYGGVILRLLNGLFVATEPLSVPSLGATLDWIYPDAAVTKGLYPGGSTAVALYQSRVGEELPILLAADQKAIYQSMIPTGVLGRLLAEESAIKCQYVFGANGSVLSYELSGDVEELLLKARLKALVPASDESDNNVVEQQLRSGVLLPLEFVSQVARAGVLHVVTGNALWGMPRRIRQAFVPHQYLPSPLSVREVAADSPCGPLFTRALDAVRHVQRGYKAQAQVAIGYVLKALGRELYMTTLPLVRERYEDLKPVFVQGKLPQGYLLHGIYLCASSNAIAAADDEMAQSFFAPVALTKAVSFITTPRNGSGLTLYLLCADGALLRYTVPTNAPVDAWVRGLTHDTAQLREGSLKVRDYVRRLAGMGQLDIRVNSGKWGRKERVDAKWSPNRPAHTFTADPYFHSFCGPLFFYADDAARYAQRLIAPFNGKPYLGAVLVPPKVSGFVAIDPVEDRSGVGNSSLEWLFWKDHAGFDVPPSNVLHLYKIAAVHGFYKSIPSAPDQQPSDSALLNNFFSREDLRNYLSVVTSNRPGAESIYLSCRGGALLKYVPALTPAQTAALSAHPAALPTAWVTRLAQVGKLSVLVTDAFWRSRGPVNGGVLNGGSAGSYAEEPWYGREKDEL